MRFKNILKNIAIAGVLAGLFIGAAHAQALVNASAVCQLLESLKSVFQLLRTLAFIGAAFIIMAWGWAWITAGEFKMDDAKKKGIAMLVGFVLLAAVGVILSFLISSTGAQTMGCDFSTW